MLRRKIKIILILLSPIQLTNTLFTTLPIQSYSSGNFTLSLCRSSLIIRLMRFSSRFLFWGFSDMRDYRYTHVTILEFPYFETEGNAEKKPRIISQVNG